MTQEKPPAAPQDENQIIAERRSKLTDLRKAGNAFPNTFRRDNVASQLHEQYGEQSKEALEEIINKELVVTAE